MGSKALVGISPNDTNISQSDNDVKHSIHENSGNDTEKNKKDTKLRGYVANDKKLNNMPESLKREVDEMVKNGDFDYTIYTLETSQYAYSQKDVKDHISQQWDLIIIMLILFVTEDSLQA